MNSSTDSGDPIAPTLAEVAKKLNEIRLEVEQKAQRTDQRKKTRQSNISVSTTTGDPNDKSNIGSRSYRTA